MRAVILALALVLGSANTNPTLEQQIETLLQAGEDSAALAVAQDAAKRGDAEGHDWLGWFHEEGRGMRVDLKAAAAHYRIAAQGSNNHAAWRLGVLIDSGKVSGQLEEAVTLFEDAAERGAPTAMVSLAVMQATGRGTPLDFDAAMGNYRRAATLGNSHGVRGVGVMLYVGQGVAADPEEAAAWMLLASTLGNEEAEANLQVVLKGLPGNDFGAIGNRALAIAADLGVEVPVTYNTYNEPPREPPEPPSL